MALRRQYLTEWEFAIGTERACLAAARPVRVPHTWSVEEEGQRHVGTGWYRTTLAPDACLTGERAFLYFHAAYRDAAVYVNGKRLFEHRDSGYTPFEVEITEEMAAGRETEVVVSVDNRYSRTALPYDVSFDWANDGGLYRPVELRITGPLAIREMRAAASPVILPNGLRQEGGQAVFGFSVAVDGAATGARARWSLHRGAADSMTPEEDAPVASGDLQGAFEVPPRLLEDIRFWHFDRPELYTLRLRLEAADGTPSDAGEWAIGFRELKAAGARWLLNGEAVRLPGMEWMPGSDPAFGMAEPRESLERMLRLVRESNSVFTRFHWQQDDWVYDWCDRHGLLVQEELPYWGQLPQGDPDALWPTVRRQIDEMVRAHRHHPSIVAWGVGNELGADTWPIQRHIRRAAARIRQADPDRLVNYVSNTAFDCPAQDGSGDGDVLMINDYIGTWLADYDQQGAWRALLDARPGRAFLPSEFGLCEPAFTGGDPRREQIFLEKMAFYRAIPAVVGTVYFCLNDYRTHIGEEGEGRMKRRVHGSVGLTGEPKPSYFAVQREYAPLAVERTGEGLRLTCKADIPAYAVCGYGLKAGKRRIDIPDLCPGESWLCPGPIEGEALLLRPNGDPVLCVRAGESCT